MTSFRCDNIIKPDQSINRTWVQIASGILCSFQVVYLYINGNAFCYHRYGGVVVHSMASINVLHSKLKDSCNQQQLQPQLQISPTHNLSAEEQLKQTAASPPPTALDQVPWVLGVVYDSLKLLV